MGALLDVIGAFAIGSMFLLTMFNTMFNIQSFGYNIQSLVTLSEISEDVVSALDEEVLANVGSDEATRAANNVFPANPTATSFTFWGHIDRNNTGTLVNTQVTLTINANNELVVFLDGNPNTIYLGPFELNGPNGLAITYLDNNDAPMAFPINTNLLFGARFDITFQSTGVGMDWGNYDNLQHRIIFWKYFKNLHL